MWWLWLLITALIAGAVSKSINKNISVGKLICISLLFAYVLFILFETIIGRTPGTMRAELVPFWSYSHSELRSEIILNYLLFIPLGILLYLLLGKKYGMKVVLIGLALSILIELTQLVFALGLFEFDDIIGNTIGCMIGAYAAHSRHWALGTSA